MWTHEHACTLTHNTDESAAELLEIDQLEQLNKDYLSDLSSAEVILVMPFLFDFPVQAQPFICWVAKKWVTWTTLKTLYIRLGHRSPLEIM